jgi:hypothetical protein
MLKGNPREMAMGGWMWGISASMDCYKCKISTLFKKIIQKTHLKCIFCKIIAILV